MATPLRQTKAGTTEVQRLLCHHLDQARKALRGPQPLSDAAVHGAEAAQESARCPASAPESARSSAVCL